MSIRKRLVWTFRDLQSTCFPYFSMTGLPGLSLRPTRTFCSLQLRLQQTTIRSMCYNHTLHSPFTVPRLSWWCWGLISQSLVADICRDDEAVGNDPLPPPPSPDRLSFRCSARAYSEAEDLQGH